MTTSRISLGRAHLLALSAIREASRAGIPARSMTPVGSVRRFAPDIGDAAILVTLSPAHHAEALVRLSALPMATGVHTRTSSMVVIATAKGRVTFYLTSPEHAGAALVWHTGSRSHTAELRARGAARGLTFDAGRLSRDGVAIATATEDDLYRYLDLPCIPAELREGADEIDCAERMGLPRLITGRDIRGDLHVHTSWSDGRDTVEAMAEGARALGYEYVAITDHSERAWSSRKLSTADVPRQREQIEAVRERVQGIVILHGVEVDIMKDGSLDFDDRLLEGFDIVLASLHDHGGQPGDALTARYLSAIHHPLVNVITHPANRSPALSQGYDVDFDRLFEAAAANGTALEVDGAPGHLDMDGLLARRAIAAGVKVAIDSDCHRADALGRQMRFGVGTARRGWIEPRHVLNTGSVHDVHAFVARKRAGR